MRPISIAYQGAILLLRWACTRRGGFPALDFFNGLSTQDQKKVLVLFKRLGDVGRIPSAEKFKKIEDTDLFEFKSFRVRFIGDFRKGSQFVIAHGLEKTADRYRPGDLDIPRRILAEDDSWEVK